MFSGEKGYFPDTILDIGAQYGNWTRNMKQLYSRAKVCYV